MELESTIHNLLSTLRPDKHQTLPPKPFILHQQSLSPKELADILASYGKMYGHSLMSVLDVFDRVSGYLPDL